MQGNFSSCNIELKWHSTPFSLHCQKVMCRSYSREKEKNINFIGWWVVEELGYNLSELKYFVALILSFADGRLESTPAVIVWEARYTPLRPPAYHMWRQATSHTHTHTHTHLGATQSNQWTWWACFCTVEESWREPSDAQGEHANSTRKGSCLCETTVLTTARLKFKCSIPSLLQKTKNLVQSSPCAAFYMLTLTFYRFVIQRPWPPS